MRSFIELLLKISNVLNFGPEDRLQKSSARILRLSSHGKQRRLFNSSEPAAGATAAGSKAGPQAFAQNDTDIQRNDTRKDGDALDLLGIPSTYEGSDMVGKGGLTEGREAE
jgi:hypothetical protein